MVMDVQAGEGAEIDHAARVAPWVAQGVSRITRLGASELFTYCGALRPDLVASDHVST